MEFLGFALRSFPVKLRPPPRSFPKRSRLLFSLLLCVLSYASLGLNQAEAQSKEYQLKAAFLFNFAQFVQWPADSFTDPNAPFRIGILGDDPFGAALETIIQGETIENRKLIVRRSQHLEDLEDCQLIFICKSEEDHMAEILSGIDSKPILTVSEIDRFAQDGGTINFYLQGDKVRFEINPRSALRRGLKLSSQLLSLGRIVEPQEDN
jgi:hypothetical protein